MSTIDKEKYEAKEYCELHRYDHNKLKIETGNHITDKQVKYMIVERSKYIERFFITESDIEFELILNSVNYINNNIRKILGI